MRTTFKVGLAALLVLAAFSVFLASSHSVCFAAGCQEAECPRGGAVFIYVYNSSGLNYFEGWRHVLSMNEGYSVSLVDYEIFDPSIEGDVVVVDPALEVSSGLAEVISRSGKPVLALGKGGALYLNLTTGVVEEYLYVNASEWMSHFLYVEGGAELHEVVPPGVSVVFLPLWEGDEVTLVNCAFKVFRDEAAVGYGFVSVVDRVVHVALHNATNIYNEREGDGGECFKVLERVVDWLARGAPRFRLLVDASDAYVDENVTVRVNVYDNWKVGWCTEEGVVELRVLRGSDNACVYFNWSVGCNVTFTFKLSSPGSYMVSAERDGCKGYAFFNVYEPPSVVLSNLRYEEGFLTVDVYVNGSPGSGVTVNFSYAKGSVDVQDFWSMMDGFTFIGGGVSSNGCASVNFTLNETATVVAWVNLGNVKNYTYTTLRPQISPPTPPPLPPPPAFEPPSSPLLLQFFGSTVFLGSHRSSGLGWIGLASALTGIGSLLAFRRIGV